MPFWNLRSISRNTDWTQFDCCRDWRGAHGDCVWNVSGAARSYSRSRRGRPHHFSTCNVTVSSRGEGIVCHDTDVFILLHFYVSCKCANALYMSSPVANRSIMDLWPVSKMHSDIAISMLAAHALTGTEIIADMCSLGKYSALKTLRMVNSGSRSSIGDPQANIGNMCRSATANLIPCCGKPYADCNTMTECHITTWKER